MVTAFLKTPARDEGAKRLGDFLGRAGMRQQARKVLPQNQLLARSRRSTSGDVDLEFNQADNFVAVGKRLIVPSLNRFLGAFGLTGLYH
jgi:hypothetical protein